MNVGAIVGTGQTVDEHGNVLIFHDPPEMTFNAFVNWSNVGHFLQPSCFFRREVWTEHGPLDEQFHFAMDVEFWLRVSKTFQFVKIPSLLAMETRHDAAKSVAERDRQIVELSLIAARHGREDIARVNLMYLVERHLAVKARLTRIINHPVYRLASAIVRLRRRLGRHPGRR
jgi:hypothetical protein